MLAANDPMAIGAVESLKAAHRKAMVVGINASKEVIDFVRSGCLGTQIAIRNLRKQPTPKEVSLKAVVMDKTNYRDYETPMEKRACPSLDDMAGNERRAFAGPLFSALDAALPFEHGPSVEVVPCKLGKDGAEINLAVAG